MKTLEDNNVGLPYFDLEVNFDPKSNTVVIIANSLALEHLIDTFKELLSGGSGRHHHFTQKVNGTIGNVEQVIIAKR
jgi:hypothetical protein